MESLPNVDGSINSNYGAHIFAKKYQTPPSIADMAFDSTAVRGIVSYKSQFDQIVNELTNDPDSRRASATILARNHLLEREVKDVPCTYAINFRIRNNSLNMSVHMRSQDAIFGMGNDAPAFSVIHEMVYCVLKDTKYPNLTLGNYHHIADSFHVYERHFEMLDEICAGSAYHHVEVPKISGIAEVSYLQTRIHNMYNDGREAASAEFNRLLSEHQKSIMQFGANVTFFEPDASSFSSWLLTRD